MLFERLLPKWPDAARLDVTGSKYHWLKNLTTECYRCDPQWWSKASSAFCLVCGAVLVF